MLRSAFWNYEHVQPPETIDFIGLAFGNYIYSQVMNSV